MNDGFLDKKLQERREAHALRSLTSAVPPVDFCSNDYLGMVRNKRIEQAFAGSLPHGSTGSRLLSGNYPLIEQVESQVAAFHEAEAALIYNSGYDANVGLLACVPQKNDVVIYDRLSHASLRDGIRLSFASSFSYHHNDVADLEKKLRSAAAASYRFVVTESVFSMDGDMAPLAAIVSLCKKYDAALIIDEAHATGVIGERGEGLVQQQGLQNDCFARIHTFGKACGAHGAAVLGSSRLKDYLVNFSRSFIYSTALPPVAAEAIRLSYDIFPAMHEERKRLGQLAELFQQSNMPFQKLKSHTPVQVVIIPGNEEVKEQAARLQQAGFDIRPILYPTVPQGQERLRIVLHAFNTEEEVKRLVCELQ